MKKIIISCTLFSLLLVPLLTSAQTNKQPLLRDNAAAELSEQDQVLIDTAGLTTASPAEVIATIIKFALGLLGVVFIILIIYAGFLWLTSAGNEDKIGKAKGIIISSIIGLAIVLFAYIITSFVFDAVFDATSEARRSGAGTLHGNINDILN